MMVKPDELDNFIDRAANLLDLPLASEWKAAVRTNLGVTLGFAELVAEFELPDDAEPAPIYRV